MNSRSFVLSAVIAGAGIGLLGNLPLLNLINCFLCLWVWVGGVVAVYLYRHFQAGGASLTAAQGAGLGALAGLIGAFVGVVVYAATSFISMPLFMNVAQFFELEGDLPFATVEPSSILGSAFVFFVLDAILYPLFGAISGFITTSLLAKQSAVPGQTS